jgi:RNA polymerase sigma-70 factor (ECF subfamily)
MPTADSRGCQLSSLEGACKENSADAAQETTQPLNFEEQMLPHLDAAYNLARWLMRNEEDAEDVVQESFMRAFRFFGSFQGGNARAWLLRIVRNTSYTWLEQDRRMQSTEFDDELCSPDENTVDPEQAMLRSDRGRLLREALEKMATDYREVLILREIEGMSYKEISDVIGVPVGTVMSRLSRARLGLRRALAVMSR